MSEDTQFSPPPVYDVVGDSAERGRKTGELTGEAIERSLRNYRDMFKTCDINWQQACDKALPCIDYANQFCPTVIEEMEGLALGSNTDIASIAALNARTEILPADYLARATGLDPALHPEVNHANECTALAFARPAASAESHQAVWLGQNWDWLGHQRSSLVVIRATAQTNATETQGLWITATEAGMLAKIGINRHGLGITLNILRSHLDGREIGMPVHIFLRALLDCESVQQACDFAASVNFASSSNMMIADASGHIASIEASPKGARILHSETELAASDATKNHHWLCHTNHFLHEELRGDDAGLTGNFSTQARLDAANAEVRELKNLADIQELLSATDAGDQSICRFPDKNLPEAARIETVFAAAMNLQQRELWVTAAQPSLGDFHRHSL